MKSLTKRHFPACAKIPGIQFDIDRLNAEVDALNDRWVSVYEANRGLCANHEELAMANQEHFSQVNLTYFESSDTEFVDTSELKAECKLLASSKQLGTTKTARHRTKVTRSENLHPAMNEHNWYHPLPIFQGTYMQQAIAEQFQSTPIRVRLSRIEAGKFLTPHIDYDTTYAVRVIVPIRGAEDVYNVCWPNNQREEHQMIADGSAYFLNTGFKHAVEHRGTEDRIALMFSLPTQEDVQSLVIKK